MKSKNFNDLFANLSHKWVSINNGGPEAVEGVLVQSRNGTFTLVQNNQVLRLQPRHVKTICVGAKGAFKQNDNNQNNEQTEENGDNEVAKSKEERTGAVAVQEAVQEVVQEVVQEAVQEVALEDAARVHALQHRPRKLLKRKIIVGKHDEMEHKRCL
ncbi:hypothetical protein AAAC51_17230 [Priestia megaterium]